MKIYKPLVLASLALILTVGCNPDDTPEPPEIVQKMDDGTDTGNGNPTGSDGGNTDGAVSSAESNALIENIVIPGSTKIEGTPPTPNEGISLDVSQAGSKAFLGEGFEIPFTSDGDVEGAYIQFKAKEAGISDSYFEVDLLDNSEAPEVNDKSKKRAGLHFKKPSDSSFDIDFTPQMETGEFCYVICVYDGAGNISAPQEVCVTINEWGGNEQLIGTWDLLRYEELDNGIVETEEVVGVEDCVDPFGDETDTRCYIIEYWRLTFNRDGTFQNEIKEFNRDTADEPTFVDFDIEILRGNWSYNVADGSMLFVIYKYEYQENGQTLETEQYPLGDGDFLPVSRIELNASQLNLIYEIDENGDGNIDVGYIEYYEKQ